MPTLRLVRRPGSLLVGLILLSLLALPGAVRAAATVSPETVHPGERVNLSADGFNPGERIDFWVTGPDGLSRPRFPAVPADANGAVAWSYDLPLDAPAGRWTAVARGVRSNLQMAVGFTVIGLATPVRQVTAEPAAAAPGTTFHFTVTALTPDERFGPWLRGPDGRDRDFGEPGSFVRITVDAEGVLRWSWTAPADALAGDWLALARSDQSGALVQVPFRITGSGPTPPERRVEPVVGAPGTRFNVVVGGLIPGEEAGSWLNTPSGTQVDATSYLKADAAGVVRWSWVAPVGAEAGRWQVVTRGLDSRIMVVLDLTVTGANAAPTPVPSPLAQVSPASGQPQSTFFFSVSGFSTKEREISYWFVDAEGKPIRTDEKIEVTSEGTASWRWKAPRLAAPGVWTMTARGTRSGLEVSLPFTILVPDPPTSSVTPGAGPAGTRFSFRATGLNVIERMDTWVERPDGSITAGTFGVRADGDGVAVWTWLAPADAVSGTWIMVAEGRDTDLIFRIPFRITE